ncbi:centaurin-gamma-1A-like isoform X2 [Thrips palmi]|nr:centaurin-gamma-1A-like isoform X2 [Thrips palmi]
MAHFRNSAEIPLILVGTQDAISENNPRVIDDSRARKLATDLKRCSYYETCATYGLNVERVFQDACQKIVHQRLSASSSCLTPSNSRPSTPLGNFSSPQSGSQAQPINARIIHQNMPVTPTITNPGASSNGLNTSSSSGGSPATHSHHTLSHKEVMNMSQSIPSSRQVHTLSSGMRHHDSNKLDSMRPAEAEKAVGSAAPPMGAAAVENNNMLMVKCLAAPPPSTGHSGTGFDPSVKIAPPQGFENIGSRFAPPQGFDSLGMPSQGKDGKDLPTPSSTPTTSRKSRRRSNLFTPSKKGEDKLRNGELGSGRAIPLKQGYLYKRSSKALNKEWKKKYVTLCDDGKLTYHPSLHDYMDDVHGKEISLQYVTVKVPGQKPRGSKTINSSNVSVGSNGVSDGLNSLTITSFQGKDKRPIDKVQLTGFEMLKDSNNRMVQPQGNDESLNFSLNGHTLNASDGKMSETPNVKKRHRRMKSSSLKNTDCDDSDGYEFFIVSLDNKQWHFEASNSEERDEWVSAIEQQILNSLQGNEISKSRSRLHGAVDTTSIQLIRSRVHGNTNCVDCDAPNPDWASLNLGVLMCIECSGIHRNLGSHISRVRSLDLDEWPQGHLSVMLALGNALANGVWEARVPRTCGIPKPTPNSSREEKERWIRAKYEAKEFLAPPSLGIPLAQQLIDAVCRVSMKCVYTLLTHCTPEDVNSTVSPRDLRNPLHLACALGNVAIAQLLIWNNANVKAVDQEGQTCLSLARAAARQASPDPNVGHLIELLQSNGAPELSTSTVPRRQPISSLPPNSLDTLPSSII